VSNARLFAGRSSTVRGGRDPEVPVEAGTGAY